jgi:methylated-DNA-[protein]-cysteine S-methyltransferase
MTPLPDSLLDAVAAAAVREGLADALFTRLATPIGRLLVVQGPRGIVRVAFEDEPEDRALAEVAARFGPRVVGSDRELAATRDTLAAYFDGDGGLGALPVDLSLVTAPYRRTVLEALHDDVGAGEVVTYGGLAAATGRPRAARAVGTACARNPVPIVVPCHRVVPGGGGLGGYGGGTERKRVLLALEGAAIPGRPRSTR